MNRARTPILLLLFTGVALASCGTPDSDSESNKTTEHGLDFTTGKTTVEKTDPTLGFAAKETPQSIDPFDPVVDASLIEDEIGAALPGATWVSDTDRRLHFSQKKQSSVRVLIDFEDISADETSTRISGKTIYISKGTPTRAPKDAVVLTSNGRELKNVELEVTYELKTIAKKTQMKVSSLALVDENGTQHAHANGGEFTFTNVASNCKEQALINFGPLPYGIPPIKFPKVHDSCSESECMEVADAWIHLHHNTWRVSQLFAGLDAWHSSQRSWAWDRVGMLVPESEFIGVEPVPLGPHTSLEFWFGPYSNQRYKTIREAVGKIWSRVKNAKIALTKIRLKCPKPSSEPLNGCSTSSSPAHHSIVGYINFCPEMFGLTINNPHCSGRQVTDFMHAMHHEPIHHLRVDTNGSALGGKKFLIDTFSHWHGKHCGSWQGIEKAYCKEDVKHLASYQHSSGNRCSHPDRGILTVEAYALYILNIGEMVLNGEMTYWPQEAPPTPVPPTCTEEEGCLCIPRPNHEPPNGDYDVDMYCPNDDGYQLECVTTKFNASDTVGICQRCDDVNGPGCPCDTEDDCEGDTFCWGENQVGGPSATGTCYKDPPPHFACLADCEVVMGNGGECVHDHPSGRARCVPYGNSDSASSLHNCWVEQGGFMSPMTNECEIQQCGPGAWSHIGYGNATIDCQDDLNYPEYFVCEPGAMRCVPNL